MISCGNVNYIKEFLDGLEQRAELVKSHVFLKSRKDAKEIIANVNKTLDRTMNIREELSQEEPDMKYIKQELDNINKDKEELKDILNKGGIL